MIDDFVFIALKQLSKPTRVSDLLVTLDACGCANSAAILDELRERRLVFEEGDRLLSLVHVGPRPIIPTPAGVL